MVTMLGKKPLSVDEIKSELGISQSSTSQHLKVLYQVGLVTFSKKGNFRIYTLRKNELQKAMHFFDHLWDEGLDRLKSKLESKK